MRVLIACEYSGKVLDRFIERGHTAISCDLLPSEGLHPEFHRQQDVLELLAIDPEFDLMIAFPPCTHLAVSGAKHFHKKQKEQKEALQFVRALMDVPIPRICIENPVGVISTKIKPPTQIIQPWMFGDSYTKTTCLWLKNLPSLIPTNIVDKGERHITKSGKSLPKWYNLPPSKDRWKIRSKTPDGIAKAMASQWG